MYFSCNVKYTELSYVPLDNFLWRVCFELHFQVLNIWNRFFFGGGGLCRVNFTEFRFSMRKPVGKEPARRCFVTVLRIKIASLFIVTSFHVEVWFESTCDLWRTMKAQFTPLPLVHLLVENDYVAINQWLISEWSRNRLRDHVEEDMPDIRLKNQFHNYFFDWSVGTNDVVLNQWTIGIWLQHFCEIMCAECSSFVSSGLVWRGGRGTRAVVICLRPPPAHIRAWLFVIFPLLR